MDKYLADYFYKLKLGEKLILKDNFDIWRVPGGWVGIIYDTEECGEFTKRTKSCSVFIPYNEEFKNREE